MWEYNVYQDRDQNQSENDFTRRMSATAEFSFDLVLMHYCTYTLGCCVCTQNVECKLLVSYMAGHAQGGNGVSPLLVTREAFIVY